MSEKKFTHAHEHLDAENRRGASLFVKKHNIHHLFAVAVHIENSLMWPNLYDTGLLLLAV